MSYVARDQRKAQKGFTLIEMSIVLVIIGLIVGGILKGQEIVENSRQKNVLQEVERIRAAVNTFTDRYKALPGDYQFATTRISTAFTAISNGDGDGIVDPAAAVAGGAANIVAVDGGILPAADAETVTFWNQLAAADLIGGITVTEAVQSGRFGEGAAVPAAAFPGTGFTVAYGTYNDFAGATQSAHWLRISKGPPNGITAGLTAKQMQALDVRVDDGVPSVGAFRSDLAAAQCGTNGGTADYQATNENVSCIALIALVQ